MDAAITVVKMMSNSGRLRATALYHTYRLSSFQEFCSNGIGT